jgi:hypothetical protein
MVTAIPMMTAKETFNAMAERVDRQCLLVVVEKIVIPVRISIAQLRVKDTSTIY